MRPLDTVRFTTSSAVCSKVTSFLRLASEAVVQTFTGPASVEQ